MFPYCCLLITFFILCSVFKVHLRQKKLHIIRFRRQADASRRKLTHSVLLPSQIRSASLGSNLVVVESQETQWSLNLHWSFIQPLRKMVGQSGLEPPTSRLSVVCSSQLSYWPVWWRLAGSNRWPPACKAGALPAELNPHIQSSLFRFPLPQRHTL